MTPKNEPRLLTAHAVANDAPKPAVLSYDELAKVLRCSRRTLEELVSTNKIPHRKLGARVIFYWPTIDEWLREGQTTKKGAKK